MDATATVSYMSSAEDQATGPQPEVLAWWRDGERTLRTAIDSIDDAGLAGPSLLPGWTRQTVVAHLARNADALVNLLTWARTGVETPMYATPDARGTGIEQTASLPAADVRAEFAAAQARLTAAVDELPGPAWQARVRNPEDRMVPATDVPWMRTRETWVHAVDLNGPVTFADIPPDVADALIMNITTGWHNNGEAVGITFAAAGTGRRWGDGPRVVSAPRADLLAWMTGRGEEAAIQFSGPSFQAPPWL